MTGMLPAAAGGAPGSNVSVAVGAAAAPPPETTTNTDYFFKSSACCTLALQFADITYRVKAPANRRRTSPLNHQERTILSGITGFANPGEVLAVLGPSGSGKSTLLSILAGRLAGAHAGAVLANGRRLDKTALRRIGYVAQDDVLYPHLTVRETLQYCAMLRLPSATSHKDAVGAVIAVLGLAACADTRVGNAFVRGVSGGERKRVSIGHELLLNPSLIILDEPTSGLDSTSAARVVSTLSALAKMGRTVVMSVHQPSSCVYRMFDRVVLLADGRGLYFGGATEAMDYLDAVGCPPPPHVNPADFLLDLANGAAQAYFNGGGAEDQCSGAKQRLAAAYSNHLAPMAKAAIAAAAPGEDDGKCGNGGEEPRGAGWCSQFLILLHRSLKERRHETFNTLRVVQIMAAAVLSGAMWWRSDDANVQDRFGLLFFVAIFWGVTASFNAVFTFPTERAMLTKERASGMYALSAYYASRMAGDLPMELALPTAFMAVLYAMAGLRHGVAGFLMTLLVLLGYILVAQGMGLAVGAVFMDAKRASTMVTVIMLVFLITGGFYITHVHPWTKWAKYTSFSYYCYRLLIKIQYSDRELELYNGGTAGMHGEAGEPLCIAALVGMFVAYRAAAYVALRRV